MSQKLGKCIRCDRERTKKDHYHPGWTRSSMTASLLSSLADLCSLMSGGR